MNRFARIGAKLLSSGLKVRTIMLALYVGIAIGWAMAVAWLYLLRFATPQAIALLQTVAR